MDCHKFYLLANHLLLLSRNRYEILRYVYFNWDITDPETANRSLEDIDAYYRTKPSLIVVGDRDAISRGRPQKYIDHEEEEIKRTAESKGVARPVFAEHLEWTSDSR